MAELKKGEIVIRESDGKNYKYLGGDPSNPSSYELVSSAAIVAPKIVHAPPEFIPQKMESLYSYMGLPNVIAPVPAMYKAWTEGMQDVGAGLSQAELRAQQAPTGIEQFGRAIGGGARGTLGLVGTALGTLGAGAKAMFPKATQEIEETVKSIPAEKIYNMMYGGGPVTRLSERAGAGLGRFLRAHPYTAEAARDVGSTLGALSLGVGGATRPAQQLIAGPAAAAKGMTVEALRLTGKAAGKPIEAVGKGIVEGRPLKTGIKSMYGSLKESGPEFKHLAGSSIAEKKYNMYKTIADYKLQGMRKNPDLLAEKAGSLANENVNAAFNIFREKALQSEDKFNGESIIRQAAERVKPLVEAEDVTKVDKAADRLIEGLRLKAQAKGINYGTDIPISDIVKFKKDLNPSGRLFKKGVQIDPMEAEIQLVKKESMYDVLDKIKKVSPETAKLNKEARRLIEIEHIAENTAPKTSKGWKDILKSGGAGAVLAGGAQIPGVLKAAVSPEAGMSPDVIGPALLGALAAGTVAGTGKLLASPSAMIPTGRTLMRIGEVMQQKPVTRIPGGSYARKPIEEAAKTQMLYSKNIPGLTVVYPPSGAVRAYIGPQKVSEKYIPEKYKPKKKK